jgi:hypothetical protein
VIELIAIAASSIGVFFLLVVDEERRPREPCSWCSGGDGDHDARCPIRDR